MELAKIKEWYADRPVSLGPTYSNIGWLIAEVERLTAENVSVKAATEVLSKELEDLYARTR